MNAIDDSNAKPDFDADGNSDSEIQAIPKSPKPQASSMPETRWSLVQRVQTTEDLHALGELLKIYSEPLRVYAIWRGEPASDAEDAVQSFFQQLIARSSMMQVNQEKGRLRTFLRVAFERHLIDLWSSRSAAKRGGGAQLTSLDQEAEEGRVLKESGHDQTPEKMYERKWVMVLLGRAMEALETNYRRRGKGDLFDAFKDALEWQATDFSYAEAGARLGMKENAVKQTVFRMRQKFRELLLWEVAQTVTNPADAEDELRQLLYAM
jgi:RNA polymerase sigma factor (sigma-70 family)